MLPALLERPPSHPAEVGIRKSDEPADSFEMQQQVSCVMTPSIDVGQGQGEILRLFD